jgi:hypothetical protein
MITVAYFSTYNIIYCEQKYSVQENCSEVNFCETTVSMVFSQNFADTYPYLFMQVQPA